MSDATPAALIACERGHEHQPVVGCEDCLNHLVAEVARLTERLRNTENSLVLCADHGMKPW